MSNPADIPGVSAWPEPVTYERLQTLVEAAKINVTPTDNQILRTRVGENVLEISVAVRKTTVLRVLGLSAAALPKEQQTALATFANNWHREKVWPTLLWTENTDGTLALRSVYTVDLTAGATDQQLATAIRLGVSASARALDSARGALQPGSSEPDGS